MTKSGDQYSDEEIARRRDEVIRRMANTPPQPRISPKGPAKAPEESAADPGSSRSPRGRGGSAAPEFSASVTIEGTHGARKAVRRPA